MNQCLQLDNFLTDEAVKNIVTKEAENLKKSVIIVPNFTQFS